MYLHVVITTDKALSHKNVPRATLKNVSYRTLAGLESSLARRECSLARRETSVPRRESSLAVLDCFTFP